MSNTLRVNLIRPADAAGILVDMTAHGFDGELEPTDEGVSVLLAPRTNGDSSDVDRRLWLALEESIAERDLPLVPMADGDHSILLRPALV
jgi:hypothetical protein